MYKKYTSHHQPWHCIHGDAMYIFYIPHIYSIYHIPCPYTYLDVKNEFHTMVLCSCKITKKKETKNSHTLNTILYIDAYYIHGSFSKSCIELSWSEPFLIQR